MSTYCVPNSDSAEIKDIDQVLKKWLVSGERQVSGQLLSEVPWQQEGARNVALGPHLTSLGGSAGLRHTYTPLTALTTTARAGGERVMSRD